MQCRSPALRASELAAWPSHGLFSSSSPAGLPPGSRRPPGPRRVAERARGCGAAAAGSRRPLPGPGAEGPSRRGGPLRARCASSGGRSTSGAATPRPVCTRAVLPARALATPRRSRRRGPRAAPVPLSCSPSGGLLSLPESFKVAMALFCVSRGGSASTEGGGGGQRSPAHSGGGKWASLPPRPP